jgi:hypothetical protein
MNSSKPKNAGLEAIGFGFYHSGLELWGKEISFGHSKKYTSGVFAVKPRAADTLMPQTRFRESVEIATILISRYRYRQKISQSCNHHAPMLTIRSVSTTFSTVWR